MNIFKNLFVIGERKAFLEILELVELSRKASSVMSRMVDAQDKNVLTESNEDMRLLEKQADKVSFKIKEDIVNGAVNPNVLDNLLSCVELADSIVDNYYFVSRELKRMANVKPDERFSEGVPELTDTFRKMIDLTDRALATLEKTLKTTNLPELGELRSTVELLEEEGDNIKDDGFDRLYASAPNIHYLQFSHFSELLHKFDDVLDSCEDISDLVVAIITSISK